MSIALSWLFAILGPVWLWVRPFVPGVSTLYALGIGAALALAAVVAGWTWLALHDAKVAAKAERAVIERSIKEGKRANAEAGKAHDLAARPGAAQRLRERACRDCKR